MEDSADADRAGLRDRHRRPRIVDVARAVAPGIPVECTRKAMPGGRALSVRAVRAGGAGMHRLGLSESILIFPEHAALVGG